MKSLEVYSRPNGSQVGFSILGGLGTLSVPERLGIRLSESRKDDGWDGKGVPSCTVPDGECTSPTING